MPHVLAIVVTKHFASQQQTFTCLAMNLIANVGVKRITNEVMFIILTFKLTNSYQVNANEGICRWVFDDPKYNFGEYVLHADESLWNN